MCTTGLDGYTTAVRSFASQKHGLPLPRTFGYALSSGALMAVLNSHEKTAAARCENQMDVK